MMALQHCFTGCVTETALRGNKTKMGNAADQRLGGWLPTSGYPHNPYETWNGAAPWRVPNVFKSEPDQDVCRQLAKCVDDHNVSRGQLRVVLLGPSGCGKTFVLRSLPQLLDSSVADDASFGDRRVVVSMDFSGANYDGGVTFGDPLVQAFVKAVDDLRLPLPHEAGGRFDQGINDANYKAVQPLLQRFLVVRLYLVAVIQGLGFIPGTAEDYFLTQLTWWAGKCGADAFHELALFSEAEVQLTLRALTGRVESVVLAVDEAGVATHLHGNTFCSSTVEHVGDPRGLLGAVLRCLLPIRAVAAVVAAGTTLRLQHCEVLGSGLGKGLPLTVLTQFPTMAEQQSRALLDSLLQVPNEKAAGKVVRLLAGRGRYIQVLWERFDVVVHGTEAAFLELAHAVRAELVASTELRALRAIEAGACS
jgi:hypothetical protein